MSVFDVKNWREKHKHKSIEPNDLEEIIKPGSGIYIGSACSEPIALTKILAKDDFQHQARDCQIFHFFSLSEHKFFDEESPTHYRHNTLSIIGSPTLRNGVNKGHCDYTPVRSAEIPRLLEQHRYKIDVAIIQTSPPDRNGWCSLGINVDINRAIVDVADILIAQINPKMPVTMGDSFIRFSDIDYFFYADNDLLHYDSPEPDEKSAKISEYIARLIENGSTLNLGIGKIPYELPKHLEDKKDLAIYSEFILESLIPLIKQGIITCNKNVHPHCMTSFTLGTAESYDFLDKNPFVEFHPTDYITNIKNIIENEKMCSVYSAMSVDLIGQISNDLKSSLYSGIGGEADMMRGTALSGGKCIVALPSITEDGKSRILPILSTQPVAVPAFDIHYVVTEYGIAYLHGKSLRERIMQMIGVAHPKYRKWLLESAQHYNFVYQDQRLPETRDGVVVIYPDLEWEYDTLSGDSLTVRPVKPTDERMFQELYYSLSEQDRIMRFFKPLKFFTHEETQDRILVDYHTKMVLVALVGDPEKSQKIVAAGAYYLNNDTNLVEISLTTRKDYRNQGIGRYILDRIVEIALRKGFAGISGDVFLNNKPMIKLLKSLDYEVKFTPTGSTLEFEVLFDNIKKKPDEKK